MGGISTCSDRNAGYEEGKDRLFIVLFSTLVLGNDFVFPLATDLQDRICCSLELWGQWKHMIRYDGRLSGVDWIVLGKWTEVLEGMLVSSLWSFQGSGSSGNGVRIR